MKRPINRAVTNLIFVVSLYALQQPVVARVSRADYRTEQVQIALNKSMLIKLDRNVADISIVSEGKSNVAQAPVGTPAGVSEPGSGAAAEPIFIPPNKVLIRGINVGTTNMLLWDNNGNLIKMLDIEVTHDLESLKSKLYEALPNDFDKISVRSAQKKIILSGEVSSLANMQAAVDVASSYLGGSSTLGSGSGSAGGTNSISLTTSSASPKVDTNGASSSVVNLLSVGGAQQVMLDVKVAEIDRKLIKGLNVKFSALQTSNNFSIGAFNGGGALSPTGFGNILAPHSFDAGALFLQAISGEFIFNLSVDAANDNQLAKILAQPTLTTLSGQPATFISGGEFPVPVPQGGTNNGTITIVFKEFGIGLKFVPIVLDSGRINLNMNVSVSELSEDAAVVARIANTSSTLVIPSLSKREASSTLELADGQTMSIAGLISDKVRENVNKFPGLGDIPGLGALFRSSKFLNQQTELVIFVTPRLAKPVLAQNAQLPTDSFVPPDDVDFYILGRTESRKARNRWTEPKAPPARTGGLDGEYGQQLLEGGQ